MRLLTTLTKKSVTEPSHDMARVRRIISWNLGAEVGKRIKKDNEQSVVVHAQIDVEGEDGPPRLCPGVRILQL